MPTSLKLLVCCATLCLSACGFQLRGSIDFPPGVEPLAVNGVGASSVLAIELRNELKANDVQLAKEGEAFNYQLVILDNSNDKRTTAIGEGARAIEYQLLETVEFELRSKEGKTVLGPSTITERRTLPNDPNKVVSTNEEQQVLRREMLQNLAAKITRQLRSFDIEAAIEKSSAETPSANGA